MSDLIYLDLERIYANLRQFQTSKKLPWRVPDDLKKIALIKTQIGQFPEDLKGPALEAVYRYERIVDHKTAKLRAHISKSYKLLLSNLQSIDPCFKLPTVMSRFRPDINPIAAIYYVCHEVCSTYDPESQLHVWIIATVCDPDFNSSLQRALAHDRQLLKTFATYHKEVYARYTDDVPLEVFHAQQMVEDYGKYIMMFAHLLVMDL